MTVVENFCVCLFLKISASRYPSRTFRGCRFFNKVPNCMFLRTLGTPGNATGHVARLLVRSVTVVGATLTPCFTF